ncbi:MAG TPA: acyltransferase family protein [Microlunatus sp.]
MLEQAVLTTPTKAVAGTGGVAPDAGSERRFLPEIQALRALAVLLVIAYHLRPDLVPGGFIGVDVFFVISGYLITRQMLREVQETGRLRLLHFWANRARRILPAGLLVILLIVLTATFVVPVTEWHDLGQQAIASVFYLQNWVLAAQSVDYSNSDNAATPFQHFWSLAVEEQFYLLWPLLVVIAAQWALRLRRSRSQVLQRRPARASWPVLRRNLLVLFGVLVIGSFVDSWYQVATADAAAYFVTTTRLWELGVGGILAILLRYTDRLRLLRSALASAGLVAIGIGAFAFTASTPFPGPAALLPTLGAAGVIIAGRTSGPIGWDRAFGWAPVQWVGNISYSLYLWHFPVAVYFTDLAGRRPTGLESLGLVMIMIVGAAGSYYWLERPIRTAPWARRSDPRALIAAGLTMLLVASTTSLFWIRSSDQEQTWDSASSRVQARIQDGSPVGAALTRDGKYRAFIGADRAMLPNPITAKTKDQFLDTVEGRCEPKRTDPLARRCDFGEPQGKITVAVVGDSHARMYTPAVLAAAHRHGWRVVTYIRNSCPYSHTARIFPDAESCLASNRSTAQRLKKLHPDVVVTAFFAGSRFVDDGRQWAGTAGLGAAWRELTDDGIRVVAIQDSPAPRKDVLACVSEHYRHPQGCSNRRSDAIKGRGILQPAARGVAGVTVLTMTDRFCSTTVCPAVIGDVLVYIDGNHISRTYSRTLAPDVDRAISAAAGLPKRS